MLVRQRFQVAYLSKNLISREEVRCTANLNLGSHVHSTDRAGEDYPVNRIITAMYPAAGIGAYRLDRNTLILGIDDMVSLIYPTDQEAPLGMKETRLESEIFSIGG